MSELSLRLKDGFTLVLPASLDSITTYVILEQETWFEKEPSFLARWLRPGMTAIDIGANLGVYSLLLARLLAPQGQVFAYEPASEPRALLKRSRNMNQADNLHVIAQAMSDGQREGQLTLGNSSELNSLTGSGPSESVQITCLDAEEGMRGWTSVDFIKIDAEGEEERILSGGKSFLERHSPLIMFEIKAGNAINQSLRSAFPRLGYRVYRLLNGAPVLVPDVEDRPIDGYELNLFAAKPDRAAALANAGLLLKSVPGWTPDEVARHKAVDMIRAQVFAPAFVAFLGENLVIDADYRDGLAGYATWRSPDMPLSERCAALDFACNVLLKVCQQAPDLARLSTLARATWEAGQRSNCVTALRIFANLVQRGELHFSEPFWPACPRFDGLTPGKKLAEWLMVSAFEQLERTLSYSSLYGSSEIDPNWLCAQPFVSAEIERRRVLRLARTGQRVEVPARLCTVADDHLNAETWRAGLVPNTWVRESLAVG